ncbi:MAG: glycosyltransferase family 1 protein [Candidatus Moranbacteria bacterium]|nr:glycosyltransferase family 1 protein [Candidatus Moranbacteria bacterium]
MKIGIDARTILNPERGEEIGAGHYAYQLIRHLLEIDKENEYVLFFDFRVREKDVAKFSRENVKIKFYPFSDYKKYLPGAYSEILGTATLAKEKLDILHTTSPMSRIPSSYSGKTIVTIYDLAVVKVPDVFPILSRTKTKTMLSMAISKADKLIAVSNSTKKDICELFKCPEDKVQVIYSGFDKRLEERSTSLRMNVLKRYGMEAGDKYMLFLGTIEPIKNITRLFEAFADFKKRFATAGKNFNHKLVMAGKRGWLAGEYKRLAKDLGIDKEVIFTGYIIGDNLAPLFAQADFFVMPSLYEGFGTTVLEALVTGVPVISSNVSSIPEIAGDAAKLVNPLNTKEIADAMFEFSQNEALKDSYREKGKAQVEKFNWEKCARETLELYKSLG